MTYEEWRAAWEKFRVWKEDNRPEGRGKGGDPYHKPKGKGGGQFTTGPGGGTPKVVPSKTGNQQIKKLQETDPQKYWTVSPTHDTPATYRLAGGYVSFYENADDTIEIGSLVGEPGQHGVAKRAVDLADAKYPGKDQVLDAFEGVTPVYEKLGFKETSRLKFDAQYAPPMWQESFGTPDIVFMRRVAVGQRAKGKGNPYHKPGGGKGGGQFTTGPGGLGKFKLVGGPLGVGSILEGLPANHPTRVKVDKIAQSHGFKNAQQAIDECSSRIDKLVSEGSITKARRWYAEENKRCAARAKKYKVPTHVAIGATSALSPRCSYQQDLQYSNAVLEHYKEFPDIAAADKGIQGAGLGANKRMALDIAFHGNPDVITGAKRRSYYNNILFPGRTNDVTVDTRVANVLKEVSVKHADGASDPILPSEGKKDTALAETNRFVSEGAGRNGLDAGAGYYILADAIRAVAKKHNQSPDTIQSVVWLAYGGEGH